MSRFSRKIEEEIKKAIRSGAFDNLPGKGEPLDLQDNPHAPEDWRLAHHLLRSNDFTLPWIQSRQEIEQRVREARANLARAWAWRGRQSSQAGYAEKEWRRAVEAFRQELAAVNERIRDYNLEAPATRFHLRPLNADQEIARLTGEAR